MESAIQIKHEIDSLCYKISKVDILSKNGEVSYRKMLQLNELSDTFFLELNRLYERCDFSPEKKQKIFLILEKEFVKNTINDFFDEDVFTRKNKKDIVAIKRFCAFYFLAKFSKISPREIAKMFTPKFDRTTILNGFKKFKNAIETIEDWDKIKNALEEIFNNEVQSKYNNLKLQNEQLRSLADAEVRQHNANTNESIHY